MWTFLQVTIVLFVTFYCHISGKLTCYNYNPSVNGTQPLDDFRCPKKCNCKYCKEETELYYSHDVSCSNKRLKAISSQDTVPTDVKYYHLEDNNISFLKNYSFHNLTNLKNLQFNGNKLNYKKIEINAFHGLQKLRKLTLDENPDLDKLLPWFDDLVSLEEVYLEHCGLTTIYPKITSMPLYAFKGSSRLQGLTLRNNFLTTIKEDVGLQNLIQLQFIDVAYNKYLCNCDLMWFRKWIGTTNVTIEDINNTECRQYIDSKEYTTMLNFDPDKLHCRKLDRILRITIPCASAGLIVVIIVVNLYRYRFHLRYWNQRRRLRKQYQRICNQGPPTINGENILYDVFVCYNSKDIQWVLNVLHPSLEEQRNFKLCVDYRDFLPGEAIATNIANAVKFSSKVLLVVSKHFAKSEWCNFELEMAHVRTLNHEDILVVVLIEKVSPKDMPILLHKILTTTTYIEWEEHPERQALFWAKLETALLSPNCPKDRLIDNA
ncbi:toll-like receptor 2 type-1 [Antedon mediterranea]|uniref:toll-like receptor 2 type-1 n=1 Tax=Antedon mediterranea TaxID=105859 RepID=UPI003AF5DB96